MWSNPQTYRDGSTEVLGTSDASCVELPMVVLTNENTASAAELFTQALRDYSVAQSVGTTTYGKGVMQVTHSLKDGSAIRITVAQYNPPTSGNYDGVGLTPDYEVTLTEEQQQAFDTLDETTDPQLKKALEGSQRDRSHHLDRHRASHPAGRHRFLDRNHNRYCRYHRGDCR